MNENTKALLDWYAQSKRDLPWRVDPTPYHVWLSEIMLQQTRVEAVKGYYERFLQTLPAITNLANAEEDVLLKLWEGLGYYSRVRNLQKAAALICDQYGGELPQTFEELVKLPGIGSYTAGAISSIAFGRREAAVDGNVLRVMARFHADTRDIALENTKKDVRRELLLGDELPDAQECGCYNQALMDLGATVCLPNTAPLCGQCPWERACSAHAQGRELELPIKAPKKPRRIEEHTILLLQDKEKTALHKRPGRGLLAGLYEYVNLDGHMSDQEVRKWLRANGIAALRIKELPSAKHIFTHVEWHMTGYMVQVDELSEFRSADYELQMVSTQELIEQYAIPSAFKVYSNVLFNI